MAGFGLRGRGAAKPAALASPPSSPEPGLAAALPPLQQPGVGDDGSDGDLDVPNEFRDTQGLLWRRSGRSLGRGAFGQVWLGMGDSGCLVAMKSLPLPAPPKGALLPQRSCAAAGSRTTDEIADALAEVALLAELKHDNIVAYCGSGVAQRHVVIVMEFVPGGSLQSVLEHFGGKLARPSAKRYTMDILRGLDFLHGEGVIHRDLKPGNVLLVVDGQCKLADFGTSKRLASLTSGGGASGAAGGPAGTPVFMSPEAADGTAVPASDIWALGVSLVGMLAGAAPHTLFGDGSAVDALRFMRCVRRDAGFGPHIPDVPELAQRSSARGFVLACLRREAAERPAARDLLSDPFLLE